MTEVRSLKQYRDTVRSLNRTIMPSFCDGIFLRNLKMEEKIVLDALAMDRALTRIAHEIIEKNSEAKELCLVGIHRKGVPLAKQIADSIRKFSDIEVAVGELDITKHRDDLHIYDASVVSGETNIGFDIHDKIVVLVDDVIFTGRTVRAAMDALIAMGRPGCIQLAVLIDRGHRELPIRGDYVGKNIPTSRSERISVRIPEYDGKKEVAIVKML
ncbi:MAG: bifunctional pyr operon transcriptional regulator/uracil phosphoribosyltransferase PyrR [Clostridia bacterium]|nr:bifunctional pyr operon transcriptional regulator/uracil phosphoribosyltransferase PyrR [Clostridia bacterium]